MKQRSWIIAAIIGFILIAVAVVFLFSLDNEAGTDAQATLTQIPATSLPATQAPATPTAPPLDGQDTPTAQIVQPTQDAQAGDEPDTPTPLPTNTIDTGTGGSEPTLEIAEIAAPAEYELQGVDGMVRLFHPDEMDLDELAVVRLEIEITDERPVIVTLVRPAPTETPNLNPNAPTLTPISAEPLTDFIAVYSEMQASLRGVDAGNFRVDAIPADGVRQITEQLTTWQWSLKPNGDEVFGRNDLAIVIFVPELNRETSILPFSITVRDPRPPVISRADDDGTDLFPLLIIGILGLAVAVGVWGFWKFTPRPQKGKHNQTKIFISYRRADSQGSTGRIYDRLVQEFGKDDVFMDVSTIEYGVNFAATLEQAIQACDVVIAIIGTEWATITDEKGMRRLDNPNDFVRREIATALTSRKRVIPALVDEALMPANDLLPDDLKALSLHNAIRIHNDSFDQDVRRLIEALLRSGATGPFEM